jgi:pimeloyl-ACP methyl ester carboxylesterase
LQPGDVIATGTPAGVGFGQKPPVYLKPGDVVEVSITGLGVLTNTISEPTATNQTIARVAKETAVPINNLNKTCGGVGLSPINSKHLFHRKMGTDGKPPIIFIHGLGGTFDIFTPLIMALKLDETHSIDSLDLEGHGLSPTSAVSIITISSYASDFHALVQQENISGATVIGHSMGCCIALTLAIQYPELVSRLVLLGPPPNPLPEAVRNGLIIRAAAVRSGGMSAVVSAIVDPGTSAKTKSDNPLAVAAVRMSLLGQDPEGYAKGCTALAEVSELSLSQIKAKSVIITGDEDKISTPQVCERYAAAITDAQVHVLSGVGHWHNFEDITGVARVVEPFLK